MGNQEGGNTFSLYVYYTSYSAYGYLCLRVSSVIGWCPIQNFTTLNCIRLWSHLVSDYLETISCLVEVTGRCCENC